MKTEIRHLIADMLRANANGMREEAKLVAEYDERVARELGPEIMEAFADDIAELRDAAAEPPPPFTPEELDAAATAVESGASVDLAQRLRRLADDEWPTGENEWKEEILAAMQEAADELEARTWGAPTGEALHRVAAALAHIDAHNEGAWQAVRPDDRLRLYFAMDAAGIPHADDKDSTVRAVAELDAARLRAKENT